MAAQHTPTARQLKAKILEILEENRVMTVATIRSDGGPQATMVCYVHDDLTLYFVVARTSQKFSNIKHDSRVSLAIGRLSIAIGEDREDKIIGLSIAGRVTEVTEAAEVERVNQLASRQQPHQVAFAPREAPAAVLRVDPNVVSVIDLSMSPGQPELVYVSREIAVQRA